MLPQRPRFDFAYDVFTGPNGIITGRQALVGGEWTFVNGDQLPRIASNRLVGDLNKEDYAFLLGVITDDQLADVWWIRLLVIPTLVEADAKVVNAWWSDDTGDQSGISLTSGPTAWKVISGQNGGASFNFTPTFDSVNNPQEIVLQYFGAAHHASLIINDVVVVDHHALNLDGSAGQNDFEIEINQHSNGTSPLVLEVEAGAGLYV